MRVTFFSAASMAAFLGIMDANLTVEAVKLDLET